ncbi:MAG: hypothetical protein IKZ96_01900 [Bacilli bacterium]|nr:hypothetical protein [Bacilli bacterium]
MTNFNKLLDEYILLGMRTGFFDHKVAENIVSRIREIEVIEDNTIRGDARTTMDGGRQIILLNKDKCSSKGEYYGDEVIFHELSHFSNDIHRDLYVYRKSDIKEFSSANKSLSEGNPLVRFPEWGMFLLDEVISQITAEAMVKAKYGSEVDGIYKEELFMTEYTEPPVLLSTKITDYRDCYSLANDFSRTIYHGDDTITKMCIDAYNNSLLDRVFSKFGSRENGTKELYELLGYMGNILIKIYEEKYGFSFKGSEPNKDKKLILTSMRRAKDIANSIASE